MIESLDLLEHFPPVSDTDWQNLIHQDVSWEPIEAIQIQPYYRQSSTSYPHIFDHNNVLICAEAQLSQIQEAHLAGAEAFSFVLDHPELIFDEIPVGQVPLFFEGDGVCLRFFKDLCRHAKSKGYDITQLHGAVAFSHQIAGRRAFEAVQGTPLWSRVIDLVLWHDRGASLVHQLAYAYAELSDVLAKFGPDESTKHLYFRIPVGERILLEIAQLRALRMGVSEILRAYHSPCRTLPVMGTSSSRYETRLDPDTYLIRQTLQYTAAMIGGCDVIVSPNVEHGLKMLQILRHEGKLGALADVAAGSWMIESLTDSLASQAWKIFQTIEAKGGMDQARTWMNLHIQPTREQRTIAVLSGDDPVVGGNIYFSNGFEDAVPHEKSLVASLENLRRQAHVVHPPTRVQIHGKPTPWLQHLLHLCAFQIVDASPDINIHSTPSGFTAKNVHQHHISFREGESLVVVTDHLLKLVNRDAA